MNATDLFTPASKKARIEIIPLIDVIFFLLATFVLFTLSLEKIATIETPLPESRPTPPVQDDMLFLQASEGGAYYWKLGSTGSAELVSAVELPARLANYKTRVATPRVLIRGDMKAKFGAAVQALDEVRKAGIAQVSMETVVSPSGN